MAEDVVVEVQTRRGRCKVITQGGKVLLLPRVMVRRFPLREGQALDVDAYLGEVRRAERPEAMKRAAWLLGQRDYSSGMLLNKLKEAGFGERTADEVVGYLKEARYVDDQRFAKDLVNRRRSKHGSRRINEELRMKGIDEGIREQALEALSHEEELRQAVLLLEKYLKGKALEPSAAFRRCMGYLARRGYDYQVAKEAYGLVWEGRDNP